MFRGFAVAGRRRRSPAALFTPATVMAGAGLLLTAVAVFTPGVLAPGDPLAIQPSAAFEQPSLTHLFGTDDSGRDVYTRVVHGAAASLGIGVAATALGVGGGAVLGCVAGLGSPRVARVIARLAEVLLAFPTLVLALVCISMLGSGSGAAVLAIGLASLPGYTMLVRGSVRRVAASDYVAWSRQDGMPARQVFFGHIVPNALGPLAAAATLGVGQAIVWVSALGFLGFGAPPPAPEWGTMLTAGRVYLTTAWWMTVFPGAAIVAVAASLTVFGRALTARSET